MPVAAIRRRLSPLALALLVAPLGAACSVSATTTSATVGGAPPAAAASAPAARRLPNDVRWVRGSAEWRGLALQAFRVAGDRLPELARGHARGAWAVILDADETVLDNSEYQRRRALVDSGYTSASWAAWVREEAATAVPGAVEFTRQVRALGGRVAIVTNRADSTCAATRRNLDAVGLATDVVLCQRPDESKQARFDRVRQGTATPGVPPLAVVAYVGDNIQDFPGMTQARRDDASAFAEFGRRWFLLPNPMYGSWEQNPEP